MGKFIFVSYVIKVKNGIVLVDILNKVVGDDKNGFFNKYNSMYYGGLGYLIIVMNGIE